MDPTDPSAHRGHSAERRRPRQCPKRRPRVSEGRSLRKKSHPVAAEHMNFIPEGYGLCTSNGGMVKTLALSRRHLYFY